MGEEILPWWIKEKQKRNEEKRMYFIIRTIIFIIILIIFLVICKRKKKKIKRNTAIIIVIIWGVILSLSYFLPVENFFYTFKSPEEVFNYTREGEILIRVDGENSNMILANEDATTTIYDIIPKSQDGWKIGNTFSTTEIVLKSYCNDSSIIVYNYKNSNDYYIILYQSLVEANKNLSSITDNVNTEFNNFSKNVENTDTKDIIYYGYTNKFTDSYRITIDGKTYSFFNE